MNKIQFIKLLELRGISDLEQGQTIASAIKNSGGEPTQEEMVKVNYQTMEYYLDKYLDVKNELTTTKEILEKTQSELDAHRNWVNALDAAGVDNWEGYDIAQDIRDGKN